MEKKEKLGLERILEEMKSGLNPSKISAKYKIPKQTISYSVNKLFKIGCIKKVGYGTWEVLKDVPKVPKGSITGQSDVKKEIRGHAFIWKIEFVQPFLWQGLIEHYMEQKKKKLTFKFIGVWGMPRTIFEGRKIWFTNRGLTIYEPLDFMGRSSFEVKGRAVFDMDRLIKGLLAELGLKFKEYRFTTSREHYGMVKNELARQFNDRKEKMIIRGEDGTSWLWIDDSKGLGELETGEPNISRQVQVFWNDHKKSGFKVNASYIQDNFKESGIQIKKNAENLENYSVHLKSHVESIQKLGAGIEALTKLIQKLEK